MTSVSHAREMIDKPVAKLRSLDKTTARTQTFEAKVGTTIQYGSLYIRIRACRETPPIETPEAAVFLQIWEINLKTNEPEWVFSGWTFSSSPGLSAVEHPVYDVWLLDCLDGEENTGQEDEAEVEAGDESAGDVSE